MTNKTENTAKIDPVTKDTAKAKPEKPLIAGNITGLNKPKKDRTYDRYIFTSAQNNTHVHAGFLTALKAYAAINKAKMLIGKFTYNKNGFQNNTTETEGIYYDRALVPFLSDERIEIMPDLHWCGELNILPTVKHPLTGLEQYTGKASSIVPHAKIALESVATMKHEEAKFLYATGCVTLKNYINKKAGQVADNAHKFGALVIEVCRDSGMWFARQIEADQSGGFYDLKTYYGSDGSINFVEDAVTAINWGDIHAEKSDPVILAECFGNGGILDQFKPKYQLFNDLFDMSTRNHHNKNSGHFLQKTATRNDTVKNDLVIAREFLDLAYRDFSQGVIVESNHDLALEKWLDDPSYNWRLDAVNALTFLELNAYIYKELSNGNDPQVLDYALSGFLKRSKPKNVTFLLTDQSFIVNGIECGLHGHNGINGSRGNPKTLEKLNTPLNTGHTHAARISGNVYTAGVTGSLDMGYNVGGSSWSHSHIFTYKNGKRTIITQKKIGDNSALYSL